MLVVTRPKLTQGVRCVLLAPRGGAARCPYEYHVFPAPTFNRFVLRTFPCLPGLLGVVALIFADLHRRGTTPPRQIPGYAKQEPTFVDALAAVRRELWRGILQAPAQAPPCDQHPPPTPDLLLEHLSYAA